MNPKLPVIRLFASPCLAHVGKSFPCLDKGFAGPCPMNRALAEDLQQRANALYALGYPYGAWVVKEDPLGLYPTCNLEFFREKPTREELLAIYGSRFLHLAPANPAK